MRSSFFVKYGASSREISGLKIQFFTEYCTEKREEEGVEIMFSSGSLPKLDYFGKSKHGYYLVSKIFDTK